MDITQIPFVKTTGIVKNKENQLELNFTPSTLNHLETIHASALFTLAESASGDYLQTLFPELIGQVIPVVRDSTIKFSKPATKTVIASPSVTEDASENFKKQLQQKGRANLSVSVIVKDIDDTLICKSVFKWFVTHSA
jgi:acyl-coenzyme A thioesterase PaaI-like protein